MGSTIRPIKGGYEELGQVLLLLFLALLLLLFYYYY